MIFKSEIIQFSINRPKIVTTGMVIVTLLLGLLMIKAQVDTDPENMLSEKDPARVFHNQMKEEFSLNDVVVLGIVNAKDPDGVFNPGTLGKIQTLTEFVKALTDEKDPEGKRVVTRDIIAPGTVDSIRQAGLGQVSFSWLMKEAPKTREEALKIRDLAMSNPLLKGTMVAEDGKAINIYIPITTKDFAYQVRKQLLEKIGHLGGPEEYHITGLPVANDTFGVEMFKQMAISAPLAMLVIAILLYLFFRSPKLIVPPMIIAMMAIITTMGLLIGSGNTVHIMSSMIPIFLMPIAVVDSIHILSECFDIYQETGNKRQTIETVMDHLFTPMFYTSITSSAGFLSLALTPIPPVQVFGIFVAFGIMMAWLLTILFVPAYFMMMKEDSLAGFGAATSKKDGDKSKSILLSSLMRKLGTFTYRRSKWILSLMLIALLIAGYGIRLIRINDNPVKWFKKSHPIRVADKVLNEHFGGTYEAYLVLDAGKEELDLISGKTLIKNKLQEAVKENGAIRQSALAILDKGAKESTTLTDLLERLTERFETEMDKVDDDSYETWAELLDILDQVKNQGQAFKEPALLQWVASLQENLKVSGVVGKSNSVTDLVKKVHMELFEADPKAYKVPDTRIAVAQTLLAFQNSHKPDDLWHLITPDYKKANIWVQLNSGDNKDMERVIEQVVKFLKETPPPIQLSADWAGLTYINVAWQDKMVFGMLKSFISSFVIIFLMMAFLFRSPTWGLMAMIPLSVTIAIIYGVIGLIGKDYDMPVAVLSALTLGLAVDFAIHFLERARGTYKKLGSWKEATKEMFEEPARAISRNVIVIAIGFTPLLAAPLVPYQTVGVFMASIMVISGIATMFVLPALLTRFERFVFKKK
jgi:predicted RND superfamily exporter protein